MRIDNPTEGQHVFVASLYCCGQPADDAEGDLWTSRAEAEVDGQDLVREYDPEYQKRRPGTVEAVVREYVIDAVDHDGNWGGFTVD